MKKKVLLAFAALAGLSVISVQAANWFGKVRNKSEVALQQTKSQIMNYKKQIDKTFNVENLKKTIKNLKKAKEKAQKEFQKARKTEAGQAIEAQVRAKLKVLKDQAIDAADQAIQNAQDKIVQELAP